MNRRRIATIAVVAAIGLALVVTPAIAQRMGGSRGGARGMGGRGMGPEFTSEQMEQIEQIHEQYRDEQVELRNALKVKALELQELFEAGDPDFDVVEDLMVEMAGMRTELLRIRVRIHRDIRPMLNEDQRMLFDKGFAAMAGRRAHMGDRVREHHMGRHGAGGRPGAGMRGMRMRDGGGPFCPQADEPDEG